MRVKGSAVRKRVSKIQQKEKTLGEKLDKKKRRGREISHRKLTKGLLMGL